MANVRLLQQQVEAYQRALEGMDKGYKADYGAYKDKVDAHNAQVDALNAGGSAWVKNANGQYVRYDGGGGKVGVTSNDPLPLVDSLYDTGDAKYTTRNAPHVLMLNSSGGVDMYETMGKKYGGWKKINPWGDNDRLIGDAPTAPKEPKAPNPLGFTEKQKGMLMNPTAGPAEMVAANAKGVAVTSSLAGDDTPAPDSAFANPEDPNNLKDRGVLARVLGGQL